MKKHKQITRQLSDRLWTLLWYTLRYNVASSVHDRIDTIRKSTEIWDNLGKHVYDGK
jgi:hypothetical protein